MRRVGLDAWLFGDDKKNEEGKQNPSNTSASEDESHVLSPTSGGGAKSSPSFLRTPQLSDMSAAKLRKLFPTTKLQWPKSRASPSNPRSPPSVSPFPPLVPLKDRLTRKFQARSLLSDANINQLQGHVPLTLDEIVRDPKKLPYLLQWLSHNEENANFHQVLLFLLEIDQLRLVPQDKRTDQSRKIWQKYLDTTSEFEICSTLETTPELEAHVREKLQDASQVLDGFLPVQKLASMRLSQEQLPPFLKSTEYLEMLLATENDAPAVPLDKVLSEPRAAHYFLLFLMQSRQHFDLYFWLHVEYVLKPLVDAGRQGPFWSFAKALAAKAQGESQAMSLGTKNDLYLAAESGRVDRQRQLFDRAQQEIFVMLRSSWYDRFMKSDLYRIAIRDSESHLAMENKEHVALDLESIIRLIDLPDGLQVHYRPHVEVKQRQESTRSIDSILTFATFVEREEDGRPSSSLMLLTVSNPVVSKTEEEKEIESRVRAFLVPDDQIMMSTGAKRPSDVIFPFQQSGLGDCIYGCVYLTYEAMSLGHGDDFYIAKGVCLVSRRPLVNSLRSILATHVREMDATDVFSHDRLAALYDHDVSLPTSMFDVDVSFLPLLYHLGSALTLQVLASALLEASIVFVSSHYSLLTTCSEALRSLLRPFSWCHVYAPVLPQPLLSYLECPTPILVGVHSAFASRSLLPTRGFYLVVDLDKGTLEYTGRTRVKWRGLGLQEDVDEREVVYLPRVFEQAKTEMDRLVFPSRVDLDGVDKTQTTQVEVEKSVQMVCLELLSSLLQDHTTACLVVGDTNESVVIFDEKEFLALRKEEDMSFYKMLLRTQAFSEVVSGHRIDVDGKEDGEGEV